MRLLLCVGIAVSTAVAVAQPGDEASVEEVLTEQEWEHVNRSVDRALEWLISQQHPNGSFPTQRTGQPAVTSLCLMAFLAQGHLPGEGRYGEPLQRAVAYIISCQKRNGILAADVPSHIAVSRNVPHHLGKTATYNHAIAGLVLSECYAMVGSESTQLIQPVIQQALDVTFQMQNWPKDRKRDEGGWRYLDQYEAVDSDLSVTGWQLMFLRSAKNAGFDVEQRRIERSIGYVRRCFVQESGSFTYKAGYPGDVTRGMAGAGILALAHSGLHHTPEAQRTGDWILMSGFHRYNAAGRAPGVNPRSDNYHYGLLTCSQAMYQLGGHYWREFFPPMADVLISHQNREGSWQRERERSDREFGNAYTTAISVLALSASNQLLPIFQR